MDILLVIIFMILGIVFFLLEIFFLPGVTLGGVAGAVFVVAGLWYSFSQLGMLAGWLTLVMGGLVFGIAVWMFIRGKILDKISLTTELKSDDDNVHLPKVAVGDMGVAISRLAPMGVACFGDKELEVKSQDGLVDEGSKIVVVDVVDRTPIIKVVE